MLMAKTLSFLAEKIRIQDSPYVTSSQTPVYNKICFCIAISLTCLPMLLFQILESPEFNKKVKSSTAKPTEFSCILKVSKQQLGTKPFQVGTLCLMHQLNFRLSNFSFCVWQISVRNSQYGLANSPARNLSILWKSREDTRKRHAKEDASASSERRRLARLLSLDARNREPARRLLFRSEV